MNTRTINHIQNLHPVLRADLTDSLLMLEALDINVVITDSYRSFNVQDSLYELGRTKKGLKVTNAKGGQSFHNYGLAFDVALLDSSGNVDYDLFFDNKGNPSIQLLDVVQVLAIKQFEWGGYWMKKDLPHFQRSYGFSTSELFERTKAMLTDSAGFVLLDKIIDLNNVMNSIKE